MAEKEKEVEIGLGSEDVEGDTQQLDDNDVHNNIKAVVTANNKEVHPKRNSGIEEETLSVLVTVPPDGGWGWVVVAASFVANFIVDGILYCYGDFLPYIKKEFDVSNSKASVPGSLLAGFYLMTGPFVSVLANKFGFQMVTVVGALFAAAAFALSSLAMNVDFLIFSYGVLGGIGFGMIYSPSIVMVGYYFEKWRGIATGIAVCGSGIGTFSLSPLNNVFINLVGWKNSFLVQAGIILICVICGMMFRPIKPVKVEVNENLDESDDEKPEEPLKARKSRTESMQKSGSFRSLKGHKPPTAAEVLHIADRPMSPDTTCSKLSKSSQSLYTQKLSADSGHRYTHHEYLKGHQRMSVPNVIDHKDWHKHRSQRSMSHASEGGKRRRTHSELSSNLSQGHSIECVIKSRRGTITQVDDKINIQRDDAFFAGSLLRLPQYKPAEKDSISYTLSVTRVPPKHESPTSFSFRGCLKSTFELFDFSLLSSPSFDLLLLSGFLTMVGYFVPFNFLKERAVSDGGWSDEEATWLLSTIGITNTLGRVISGVISGFPGIDATFLNNAALAVAGLSTMASGFILSVPYQYTYCAVFGFSTAAFASLRSIMVVDLLGLENLNNAFGILLFTQGFGSALGAPLAGAIQEATNDYNASFYLSGALIALSGFILLPLKRVNRWEKSRTNSILKNSQAGA